MGISDEMSLEEVTAAIASDAHQQAMGNHTYSPVHMQAAVRYLRELAAPDTHGHPSVEDWLASKGVEIGYCNDPDGWFVYVPPQGAGTAKSINSDPYPTYLAARAAAVAWVKQQEASDVK